MKKFLRLFKAYRELEHMVDMLEECNEQGSYYLRKVHMQLIHADPTHDCDLRGGWASCQQGKKVN